jgi:predicted Zn-dependent peptidase
MSNTTNNQEGAMIKGEHMIIDVNQDSFELSIHINTGARDESEENNGVSHL